MRVAIHQPNYLPWCGYFAKMQACDLFVFYDDVQMPNGRSYVSRTQVRTPAGPAWLTIPTHHGPEQAISEVAFADARWPRKHLATFQAHYARSPHFREIMAWLAPLYEDPGDLLAPFNMRLVRTVAAYLGISCGFVTSSSLDLKDAGSADDRLIAVTQRVGGTVYVSGQGGQKYQDPDKFRRQGLELEVCAYHPVPYSQGPGMEFAPGLSIVDALFHTGPSALSLLRT